jgi:hypothetical protein
MVDMRTITIPVALGRAALGVVHVLIWLSLLVLAVVLERRVVDWLAFAPTLVAMGYAFLVPGLARFASQDGPWAGTLWLVGFLCGMASVIGSLLITLGLDAWYVGRYGVQAVAMVTASRCLDHQPHCGPQFRLMSTATERDLGWVSCWDGRWEPGTQVPVRVDQRNWFRPVIESCPYDATSPPPTVVAVSLAVGVCAFASSTAASLIPGRQCPPRPLPLPTDDTDRDEPDRLDDEDG